MSSAIDFVCRGDALDPRGGHAACARRRRAGEVLPLPVFRYRPRRIKGEQGRGGLGNRFTGSLNKHTQFVKILFYCIRVC